MILQLADLYTNSDDGSNSSSNNEEIEVIRDDEEFRPEKQKSRPFKTSWPWRNNFMKRHGFSLRKPQAKCRPKTNPITVERHQFGMEQILAEYPVDYIVNADETSWKSVDHRFTTASERGSETVNCLFEGDPKMRLIALPQLTRRDENFRSRPCAMERRSDANNDAHQIIASMKRRTEGS
jgi:hypothetical protein